MRRADDALLELPGQDKLCVLALRVDAAGPVKNLCGRHLIFRVNRCRPATGAECSRSPTPAPSALHRLLFLCPRSLSEHPGLSGHLHEHENALK